MDAAAGASKRSPIDERSVARKTLPQRKNLESIVGSIDQPWAAPRTAFAGDNKRQRTTRTHQKQEEASI